MSREVVRCVACGCVHLQVARAEVAEDLRPLHQVCWRCSSNRGFVPASHAAEEARHELPVCVPWESPQEAGIAMGLYELSDAEVMRRIRERGGTR